MLVNNFHNIQNIYYLTPMQKSMLFAYLNNRNEVYFEQVSFKLTGKIDFDKFRTAWRNVINRNPMLRTIFEWEITEDSIQLVLYKLDHVIEQYNFTKNPQFLYEEFLIKDQEKGFDLQKSAFRIKLLMFKDDEYRMVFSYHHIIMDGWSNALIIRQFLEEYGSMGYSLCKDFSFHYDQYLELCRDNTNDKELFWTSYLQGSPGITRLYYKKENVGCDQVKTLHGELEYKISDIMKGDNISLSSIIYFAYAYTLSLFSYSNDIAFGTVVSGRNLPVDGIEEYIGNFICTIPFRAEINKNERIVDALQNITNTLVKRSAYEVVDHNLIHSIMGEYGQQSHFESVVVIENYPIVIDYSHELGIDIDRVNEKTDVDIIVGIDTHDLNNITFSITYRSDFNDQSMQALFTAFKETFSYIVRKPLERICDISYSYTAYCMKPESIFGKGLFDAIDVLSLILKHCHTGNGNIAIIDDNQFVTYRELANHVIQYKCAIENYVSKGDIVGISLAKSAEAVYSILAILMCGVAFCFIDPQLPHQRKQYIIKDCAIRLLIGERDTKPVLNETVIDINCIQYRSDQKTVTYLGNNCTNEAAYVIYTSGATGLPKGVLIDRASLSNLILYQSQYFKITPNDNILLFSSLTFDASMEQLFLGLTNGATITILHRNELLDSRLLNEAVERYKISHIHAVPSYLMQINLEKHDCLKRIIAGGEMCPTALAEKYYQMCRFYNEYGPTETTITAVEYEVDGIPCDSIPIGKPVGGMKVHILNENVEVPVRALGELVLEGINVGLGYLNSPYLTNEKFVLSDHDKMYRTGDIVYCDEDGILYFIGRADHQVKVHGYRVELNEIENTIFMVEGITNAIAAVIQDDAGDQMIVAFYSSKGMIGAEELKEQLAQRLPYYMIPKYCIQIERFPTTTNGKIDREATKGMFRKEDVRSHRDASVETSDMDLLLDQVQNLLGVATVTENDNFFALGGDSIKAMQLVTRLRELDYSVYISDMFKWPVLKDLLCNIDKSHIEISDNETLSESQLTPIQKHLFDRNFSDINHINQALMLNSLEWIDIGLLKETVLKIACHHDSLRMYYNSARNVMIYADLDDIRFDISEHICPDSQVDEYINKYANLLQRNLDISTSPLFRIAVFRTKTEDHVLLIVHHLIIDGLSWRILLEDLSQVYASLKADQEYTWKYKSKSYQSWSNYLYKKADEKATYEYIEYWNHVITAATTKLERNLNNATKRYETISIVISSESTREFCTLGSENFRIDSKLLAVLSISLHKWKNVSKILINHEVHGRYSELAGSDYSRTIGWFTDQYPIVLQCDEYESMIYSYEKQLKQLNTIGYTYGLLRYLSSLPENDIQLLRSCEPDISFNYMGQVDQDYGNSMFAKSIYSVGDCVNESYFQALAVNINGILQDNRFTFTFDYNAAFYKHDEIRQLASFFQEEIEQYSLNSSCPVDNDELSSIYELLV